MKTTLLGSGLVFALSIAVSAQSTNTSGSGSAANNTSVTKNGNAVSLASGTEVAAELQNSLNVKKAKVGDEVVLKTTESIKQNGETVVRKGSKLVGHVTEVSQRAKGEASSKVSILFDTLRNNDISMPVTATIMSVTNVAARTAVGNNDLFADSNTSASSGSTVSASRPSSGGGGLLGGVGSTVGGVANTATSTVGGVAGSAVNTVGGVANTAGKTVGSTVGTASSTIRGLSISSSTDASANGSSTLTMNGGNLKLDKGTTFNLSLSNSTSASTSN